ncbi:MAG: cohesin domain-containing protein [Methanosarcinaceae archaeon]
MYVQVAILLVIMVSIAQAGDVVSISDVALDPGDSITIPIMIHGVTGVAAVGVNLSYNPRVVNITDAHQGDFTGFFGFDNRNVTDGWIRINTFTTFRNLTGDLKVAYVTIEAVGKGGDASPLNIEVLSIADSNGANVPGTAHSGTFSTLAPTIAATTTNRPTNAPVSTYTASDLRAVPTPVDKPATEQTQQPPEKTLPARPSEGITFHSVPGFNALLGLLGLATAYLLMRR